MRHNRSFALASFFALAIAAVAASPAFAALKPGDAAPDFTAEASLAGKAFTYQLAAALEKGPVVVFFYPSAFTGGCNIEAHTFAENADKFDAAGASVIGVSQDDIERLNAFSSDEKYCAGKIAVASDADAKIAAAFALETTAGRPGATDSRGEPIEHGFTERTTFVITPDGKIEAVFSSAADKISPADHATRALAAVQDLAGIEDTLPEEKE